MQSQTNHQPLLHSDKMAYDEVVEKAGGFGRFQWFAVVVLVLSKLTGDMMINNLAYYEL